MRKIFLLLLILIACTTTQPIEQPPLKPLQGQQPTALTTTQDGQTLAYQLYDAGKNTPAVILVHMLGRTREDYNEVAKWLQTNKYTVITYDSRGHGQSTGNWQTYTPEEYNKMTLDLAAITSILENKGTPSIAIIGASIGANTANNYASQDEAIKTVILLSPGTDYKGITLNKQKKPTLAIASTDDAYSMQTVQEIPNAQKIIYENSGHGTNMFTNPQLAPTILDWLKEYNY